MHRTVIDSVGVALPAGVMSTSEVLAGCVNPPNVPLEVMTGIASRRVAGDGEYSFDLAARAARDCFAGSSIGVGDVDLLISASISRYDAPMWFTYEPATSVRLAEALGCRSAWTFDVSNACAGTFTGIYLADALIRSGRIGTALVVSGEYITHLMRTAQKQITEALDSRLSCLTLGDAGTAVLLTRSDDDRTGFEHLSLRTIGTHHELCVAGPTDAPYGGAIMKTDMLRLGEVGVREAVAHTYRTLNRLDMPLSDLDRVIPHQTSLLTIKSIIRQTNKIFASTYFDDDRVINNLAERGNTSTTTHLVALSDASRDKRIRAGESVLFGIGGSGINVGTAIYHLDDLPDRLASGTPSKRSAPSRSPRLPRLSVPVTGIGFALAAGAQPPTSLDLIARATAECLADAGRTASEVELLIHAGLYRSGMIAEPAMAAVVAGELGFDGSSAASGNFFGFDLSNSALGVFDACRLAAELIRTGEVSNALVVTAEVEECEPGDRRPAIAATGSALYLTGDSARQHGYLGFHGRHFDDHIDAYDAWATQDGGRCFIRVKDRGVLEDLYLEYLPVVVGELLESMEVAPESIRAVIPPSVSAHFAERLRERWPVFGQRVTELPWLGGDLFTSSIPAGLRRVRDEGIAAPGDLILITSAGSGIQIGAALYRI